MPVICSQLLQNRASTFKALLQRDACFTPWTARRPAQPTPRPAPRTPHPTASPLSTPSLLLVVRMSPSPADVDVQPEPVSSEEKRACCCAAVAAAPLPPPAAASREANASAALEPLYKTCAC